MSKSYDLFELILDCAETLRTYQEAEFYFSEFLRLLPKKTARHLRDPHLSLSESLDLILECNYDKDIAYFLEAIENSLSLPQSCAQILSKESFLSVSLPAIMEGARELNDDLHRLYPEYDDIDSSKYRNIGEAIDSLEPSPLSSVGVEGADGNEYEQDIGDDLLESYFKEDGDEVLPLDIKFQMEAVGVFREENDQESWMIRQGLWRRFQALCGLTRIKERHPLYATEYSLYLPPAKRLLIADPIEQIILDSTKSPVLIHKLTPREFEKYLATIFEGFGFQVQLTAQTHDGGVDILCMKSSHDVPIKIAIEAKRYRESRPVSVNLVRNFVGANKIWRANKLVFVTTSRYTREAEKYAKSPFLTELLALKQLPDIVKWANEFKRLKFTFRQCNKESK